MHSDTDLSDPGRAAKGWLRSPGQSGSRSGSTETGSIARATLPAAGRRETESLTGYVGFDKRSGGGGFELVVRPYRFDPGVATPKPTTSAVKQGRCLIAGEGIMAVLMPGRLLGLLTGVFTLSCQEGAAVAGSNE